MLSIVGEEPTADMRMMKDTEIKKATVWRLVGTIMHAFYKEPTLQAKTRSLIQPHLRDLRNVVGKDNEVSTLGPLLHARVQKVLAMR